MMFRFTDEIAARAATQLADFTPSARFAVCVSVHERPHDPSPRAKPPMCVFHPRAFVVKVGFQD
jgi:hypothetical protein